MSKQRPGCRHEVPTVLSSSKIGWYEVLWERMIEIYGLGVDPFDRI